ncbi:MAG: bifunctional diguanylate cyclase/phosphodiesterase [Alphaproteobacteria bacterium]|nr:bifunctional diguanylate cyclase/phosphodiesterase [Alphaproteobacteria bacterium]MBV9370729.1 bifunctional diguanylate cyclase/phosphodiesterase [Alphaproteobacteria bacterium]MBV9899802.1 bifunctional diguanylate cyclase/phosphodiesterase [Alphaproteobacteria bacterium]
MVRRAVRTADREAEINRARQDFLDALPVAAAVVCLDGDGTRVQVANDGYGALSRAGHGPSFIEASGLPARIAAFLRAQTAESVFEVDDGQGVAPRVFSVRMTRMRAWPALGARALVTLLERTAEVETEKSLRAEMVRDSLTGLANRTAFNEAVEAVLDDPAFQPGSHAVLVLDITRFSRVNECVGALAGDELLLTFARRLCSAVRAHDLLARTGGNEFALLMRLDRGLEEALSAAERIRAALGAPFRLSELEIRVDCAMGCALLGGGETLAAEVLRNAQFALKRAKGSGRVRIYEPKQARAARRRFSIETALRRAIEAGELRLAFQPIIALGTGAVAGFEALSRWDRGEEGEISPGEFIPVAEESGLIVPLGRWALETALATLAGWDRAAGRVLPLTVNVNLSPIQVVQDDVAAFAASALARHGLAGERLTLELTESAIIRDPPMAMKVIETLKAFGVRVAVDDFGTGYTSLAYLQRLPIDVLKIDRSFVSGMVDDEDSVAIVRAILSLSAALGMETTAEGIDTPKLASALKALGCSHGQGFHFAAPLSAADALDYWLARRA